MVYMVCAFAAGFGAKRCRDEAWIEHQDDFDQILANLNAQAVSSNTRLSVCPDQIKESPPQPMLKSAVESKRLLCVHGYRTITYYYCTNAPILMCTGTRSF